MRSALLARSSSCWLALLLAASCAPSPTQLIVVVDTDLRIPDDLDRVTVSVTVDGEVIESEQARPTAAALPLTLSVIPSSEERLGPIVVEASGYDGTRLIVTRSAEVSLVRGETRVLSLFLLASCRDVTCEQANESCGEMGCRPRRISELPPWTGQPPRIDAGLDAPGLDAPGLDAPGLDAPGLDAPGLDAGGPDAGPLCVPGGCDDGVACTTDTCEPATGCAHTRSDAACDDRNGCTIDACGDGGCTHAPATGSACDDGAFCNGLDSCGADGACSGHAGNPCGAGTCLEASDGCDTRCTGRADCPEDSFGAWSSCSYADGCDETSTRTRTARTWSCDGAGRCTFADGTQSDDAACARETDGVACGSSSCGGWSCGGYSSTCDESGTESRSCSDVVCTAGACGAVLRSETRDCARDTDGAGCGTPSCEGWSACGGFADACDTTGTRTRTCFDPVCAAGGCAMTPRTESESCSRSTDGDSCGGTTCSLWSGCSYADTCDESATEDRTCADRVCAGGTCTSSPRPESRPCSRDTDGTSCGAPVCGDWSRCEYAEECAVTGVSTRECAVRTCAGGSCNVFFETQTDDACGVRSTEGRLCGDPLDCVDEACSGGSCTITGGGCPGGTTCCYPGCYFICP
jgi:hypothetical protein